MRDNAVAFVPRHDNVYRTLDFWLEYDATAERSGIHLKRKENGPDLSGHIIITAPPLIGSTSDGDRPADGHRGGLGGGTGPQPPTLGR